MMTFSEFEKKFEKIRVIEYPNATKVCPKVSVCIQTYQHSHFISQCLDGVLMQITDFNFEILLGEDDSSDCTREICLNYAKKYPEKIKLFLHHRENVISINGKPTGRFNLFYNFHKARGKYIALCEGDDYWTDKYKLQKQVDFLEANGDYVICFHNSFILEDSGELILSKLKSYKEEQTYTIEDLAEYNFIHTASVVFRNGLIEKYPSWFFLSPAGDYPLYMLNARHGKLKYFPDAMAVYRLHDGGVWSNRPYISQIKNLLLLLDFLIFEFHDQKTVVRNLTLQKFSYINDIVNDILDKGQFDEFRKAIMENEDNNPGFLKYWIENGMNKYIVKKQEVNKKLDIILNSTTYRLLRKLRIFK